MFCIKMYQCIFLTYIFFFSLPLSLFLSSLVSVCLSFFEIVYHNVAQAAWNLPCSSGWLHLQGITCTLAFSVLDHRHIPTCLATSYTFLVTFMVRQIFNIDKLLFKRSYGKSTVTCVAYRHFSSIPMHPAVPWFSLLWFHTC